MSGEPSTLLLEHHLKALKLPTFLRDYKSVAAVCAQERADYPAFLLRLAERELLDRERRAAERRIRDARFPVIKSLETFDFAAQPSINAALVRELIAHGEYLLKKENVLLVGNPGTLASSGDGSQADNAKERQLLDEMQGVADQARGLPDAKVIRLVEWIRKRLCAGARVPGDGGPQRGAKWTDLRLLIFPEYDDTKRYLINQLRAALTGTDLDEQRIEVFHGPTPPDKRAFNLPPHEHPVRILVATDAAREGLNLQAHCHHLFHFDVPWNPSRMEQRNGRIDRKPQPAPRRLLPLLRLDPATETPSSPGARAQDENDPRGTRQSLSSARRPALRLPSLRYPPPELRWITFRSSLRLREISPARHGLPS